MRTNATELFLSALSVIFGCACGAGSSTRPANAAAAAPAADSGARFADDVAFLRQHTELVVLQDATGSAQVAVAPEYQGRVMTSSAAGLETSSPAAALAPRAKLTHVHRTVHLIGPRAALDGVAKQALGTSLHDIEQALRPSDE